jgi:capsular polysaccharide transport system permease protein
MEILDPLSRIREIKLEPLLSKGELILDKWWEHAQPRQTSLLERHWLFLLTVCLPLVLAIVYFGFIASGQFVSEAHFVVRTSSHSDLGNIASFMQDQKISRASDETFAVAEYLKSRDILNSLVAHKDLRAILSRPEADFINRFPNFYSRDNWEELYEHFLQFVDVRIDAQSGIATLRVRAFRPEDAQELTIAMLSDAESLVNHMNTRVFDDTMRLASAAVEEERGKFIDVEKRLTQYRNSQNVVDPNKESAAALDRLGKLMGSLMQSESALSQEIAQAPLSPQIESLRASVASMREEIAKQRGKISGTETSLVNKLSDFDQLMLDRELASRSLGAAVSRYASARQDLLQQQYYLQPVVEPNLPDLALYPKRMLNILFTFVISLCAFWIARSVLQNIMEHVA